MQPADMQKQATLEIPTTKLAKNLKQVAAGKAITERTRLARKAQKQSCICCCHNRKEQGKKKTLMADTKDQQRHKKRSHHREMAVTSMFGSMIGIYYKWKEIKKLRDPKRLPHQHLWMKN